MGKSFIMTVLVVCGLAMTTGSASAASMCQMDADCPVYQKCCDTEYGAMCVDFEYEGECNTPGGGGGGGTTTCPAGQFKKNGTCVACTTQTGHSSATSSAGSTAITQCYLPRNTRDSNTRGSYSYTANCFYSV